MIQSTFPFVQQLGAPTAITDPIYSGSSLANAVAWCFYLPSF